VLQRALSDFNVEYELLVAPEPPEQRPFVLSRLHAAVQDEFNAEGVQIMYPNFSWQPADKVTVPRGPWFPDGSRNAAP
jgi:small-conductance mechanosensitive channel